MTGKHNMQFIPNILKTKYYHIPVNAMLLLYEICKNNFCLYNRLDQVVIYTNITR